LRLGLVRWVTCRDEGNNRLFFLLGFWQTAIMPIYKQCTRTYMKLELGLIRFLGHGKQGLGQVGFEINKG
jgi:hypothetical protein